MHRRAEALRAGHGHDYPSAVRRLRELHLTEGGVAFWWRNAKQTVRRVTLRLAGLMRSRLMRRLGFALAGLAAAGVVVAGSLWVRLANGPISLDIATPWLTAAISQNLGNRFRIEVAGTVLERDEHGRTAMRMRDIMVRDRDGTVIASAPKAEVGFSSSSLLSGHPRAQRLNLVGAELAVRIEADGAITVSTGAEQHPLATTPALVGSPGSAPAPEIDRAGEPKRGIQENFAAFLAWVDSLGAFGLDGGDLTEVGLKSGNLTVDDRRNGQQSRFENIHLSLTRPSAGALEVELGSENAVRPWQLTASVKPGGLGVHSVDLEAREILLRNLLLALRLDGGQIDADAPISATLRADIGSDGIPQFASGRLLVGAGAFTDATDPEARIAIDRAEISLDWNATQRTLALPFHVVSGGNRMTLAARVDAPREANGSWAISLNGGSVVLAPTGPDEAPLTLNRVQVRGRLDPLARRLNIEQAEVAGQGVSVAMSGNLDFSGPEPRLAIGMAARKLPAAAFRQMWPPFVTPAVRTWIIERVRGGIIEQGEVATNAPISNMRTNGPPMPDDGLSVTIVTTGTTVRPFDRLPEIRDADLVTRIKGRNATVTLGRGTIEMASGRKLTLANGVFEVPDSSIKNPPAKVRVRVDGPVAAAAELLNQDRLKDASAFPIDPATTRGNVLATVNLALPLNVEVKTGTLNYAITADIVNFATDRFLMSQKVEAQTLRATANNQGYQIKGDMRIGGTPATVELRHAMNDADAELRLNAVIDDAARNRFGLDPAGGIIGPVPIKVAGRVSFIPDQENRLAVEADFTQAKFDNLLPGWSKVPSRQAKASFTYVTKGKPVRLDDVVFDGGGASMRGAVEFDANGDFATANFPVFGLADGDKASLKVERTPDNLYKATLRGDAIDGRGFVKTSMAGGVETKKSRTPSFDLDLDAKLGTVTSFKGEALHNLDLHLLRRTGVLRSLALNARLGEGVLQGELRGKPGERQIIYLESSDAGALLRFSDTYPRMLGGQIWITMDLPTPDGARQEGLIDVREFAVRGEQALDAVAAGAPNRDTNGVQFSRMRVEFTRTPGKMSIHQGVVAGPTVGVTIDGVMDYAANEVHMRGTFVPLYGLNAAFGQIPIVGLLLGADTGLIGSMTYEVYGPPGAPVLRVNPISMLAPGFVRKFLEFPSSLPNGFPAPDRP
jgi:hypothetical protein